MSRVLALWLVLWAAQVPQPAPALEGRVIVAGQAPAKPVARALVIVDAGDGLGERLTATDTDGRFRFIDLERGRYLVRVTKTGWVPSFYGSPRPGRPPGVRVTVAPGTTASIEIPLTPGSVIAGRVIDGQGRPMARQSPWLLESRMVDGRRMLSRTQFPQSIGSFERSTNDLGEFRLFGLPPGTYYLSLTPSVPANTRLTTDAEVRWALQPPGAERDGPPPLGPTAGYARLFYPGTPDPDRAIAITVGPGQVREDLEFVVEYSPGGRIEGIVHAADGSPATGARVSLELREPRVNLEGSVRTATADAQGRFVFNSLPPDDYRVSASASSGAPTVRDLWAHTDVVTTGRDVTDLALTLAPAARVSGRVVFNGSTVSPPSDLSVIRVTAIGDRAMARALAGGSSLSSRFDGQANADGTFTIAGLPPDRYLVEASWPGMRTDTRGWWLSSVHVGNRDLGDAPLDVEANSLVSNVTLQFRDRMGTIEGTLLDANGRPTPEYFVLAFPVERESWTTTSRRVTPAVRPATDGRFVVTGVPRGDYYLAVVTEVESDDVGDARFLEALVPLALKVTVAEGATVRQDLRVAKSIPFLW